MSLEKATIRNITDGGEPVVCLFRPEKYTFAKTNSWTEGTALGKSFESPHYQSGGPMTLELDLVFDTYERPPGGRDVRTLTNEIWKMMQVSKKKLDKKTNKGEPPDVEFRWGLMWSFKAVIKSISQTFTLFDPDGTPVRSTMHIAFTQSREEQVYPGQNPTSGGYMGYAVHTVIDGETIDMIAFQEYGSSTAWRHLAEANELDDPTRLQAGQRLVLYPLET